MVQPSPAEKPEASAQESYKPGDKVARSGVYTVLHDNHGMSYKATLLRGETFPSCKKCGMKVRFAIFHTAVHTRDDENFKA